jgi:hypothetical protein
MAAASPAQPAPITAIFVITRDCAGKNKWLFSIGGIVAADVYCRISTCKKGFFMVDRLQEAAQALSSATGWPLPAPDESGRRVFPLEGMDFSLYSPDGRLLFFGFELSRLDPEGDMNAQVRALAKRAAASMLGRKTVLSLKGDVACLHRECDLARLDMADIPDICADFLNDCDWWRLNADTL